MGKTPKTIVLRLTVPAIVLAAAAARGATVAVATAAAPPAAVVGSKAAPVIASATAAMPSTFAPGALAAAGQKSVATTSVCGMGAPVVMSLERCFVFAAEHGSMEKEVTELVVVDATTQASVERSENPFLVSFPGMR